MKLYDYRYDYPIPLPGDRERVFAALVDPDALERWFAEHAEVEPREGGAYRFWGRHTLGMPSRDDARQAITRFEPGRVLAYRWRVMGCPSTVTLSLAEGEDDAGPHQGPTTRLTVQHHFDELPDIGRAAELVDDLWRIHTGSLLSYLMGQDEIFRADFSGAEPEVECSLTIDAPPETVFKVLTTPEYISQWFPAPDPVVEPRVGGQYGFGMSYEQDGKTVQPPPCTILEYEEDRRLAITWPDWRGDADVPDQRVAFELEDLGGKTRLTLRHDGFVRPVDVSDYPFGWQHFLREIARVSGQVEQAA